MNPLATEPSNSDTSPQSITPAPYGVIAMASHFTGNRKERRAQLKQFKAIQTKARHAAATRTK